MRVLDGTVTETAFTLAVGLRTHFLSIPVAFDDTRQGWLEGVTGVLEAMGDYDTTGVVVISKAR